MPSKVVKIDLADQGYAEAAYQLGQFHRQCHGNQALKWYMQAAESNDPDLIFQLVRYTQGGDEWPLSPKEKELLQLAADQDHLSSNEVLLLRYPYVPPRRRKQKIDDAEVKKLLLKTASLGSAYAIGIIPKEDDLLRDLLLTYDCKSIFIGKMTRYKLYDASSSFAHYLLGRVTSHKCQDNYRPTLLY
uniref:Sel1 repeat family protein n=1 Tax=Attheya septentrionalis TaxID=420275 RepID=A0A7S2ULR3_9STRA|mmetsp:Transcript_3812/g.6902  ORF Transcript_3812/g.6902 Transcript_3812/m.6902 type:complete len:188 (+) Transcript_3812:1353-1916(+)